MTISNQPELNIGIVGHIDHGKTTLLYKLTGVWADKHSEELKRGITIKLGYADVVIRKCEKCHIFTTKTTCECGGKTEDVKWVSFVDAPGHEMLMATMLGGAAVIDAALLVIAANEPFPQPQTKEHLLALEAKGITQVIIAQNKLDLVTREQALKQHTEIKEFVKNTIAKDAIIVPICAQQEINISALLEAITKLKAPERDTEGKPLFLIARSFDINRPGTPIKELTGGILGGCLKSGKLKIGDKIEIKPGISKKKHEQLEYKTIKTKILGLMAGSSSRKEIVPSGSLAIQTSFDPLLTKADALAGSIAGLEGSLPDPVYKIKLKLNLFKEIVGAKVKESIKIEPIKTNENLMLSVNTATTVGLVISARNETADLSLKIPIVPFKGDRVGIARNYNGHWRLVGWGEII
jgi:translation initiation factor 2 subunit 3